MGNDPLTCRLLVTICARAGSKGLPGKNMRLLNGMPLLAHTVSQAVKWQRVYCPTAKVIVSTDGDDLAKIAQCYGAEVPFRRPSYLATDKIGKLPVLTHAVEQAEKLYETRFDLVLDLDPTSPIRTDRDINNGLNTFHRTGKQVCFSVTEPKKNPYFNVVERNTDGCIRLVKGAANPALRRQEAQCVWDMNASIYVYARDFLIERPKSLWDGDPEIFEMPPESSYDIDRESDFIVTEALLSHVDRSLLIK